MTWITHQIILGVHILLAITWVGGVLFTGWGVYPASRKLPVPNQRLFLKSLMNWTHWLFILAGSGVIVTGILLGTVLGPIRYWGTIWNTTYGQIWFTALMIALFALAWGTLVGYRQSMKVFQNDLLWDCAAEGDFQPLNRSLLIVAALESVEIISFIALIACMVLLH